MREIDLIPEAYRLWLWRRRWLYGAGVFSLLIAVAMIAGLMSLRLGAATIGQDVEMLQELHAISTQQRADLERLDAEKAKLEHQWRLLTSLRSGAAAERTFLTVDRALTGEDIWFQDWRFQRAGIVAPEAGRATESGYFIVLPNGSEQPASAEAWRIQTHMTIKGQAEDHAALSRFVRALFAQPEIEDVRVLRTSLRRYTDDSVIDFDVALVLNSATGAT